MLEQFAMIFAILRFVLRSTNIWLFYKFLFAIIFNNSFFLQAEIQPKTLNKGIIRIQFYCNAVTSKYVCMSEMHRVTTRWRPEIFASKMPGWNEQNW